MSQVRAGIATITPEQAHALLGRNVHNRGIVRGRVLQYAADLVAGDWQVNGEAIKVASTGQILDGQHRLLAIIEADRSMTTVLITGLDPRSQETMDQGMPRTIGHALRLRRETDANHLGAAARIVCLYERDGRTFTAGRPTPTVAQVLRTLDRHPELRDSVRFAGRHRQQLVGKSLLAALHYLFSRVDRPRANAFVVAVAHGPDSLVPAWTAPAYLHEMLAADLKARTVQHARVKGIWLVMAWNAWHAGDPFPERMPPVFPAIAGYADSVAAAGRDGLSSRAASRPAVDQGSSAGARNLPDHARDVARAVLEASA